MTEAVFDLRYLAESQPSLCIPRVFNNITEARIRQVFDDLGLGKISRIDIKERKNEKGESFKRVYVHFDKWFWNDDAQAARRKLVSGKEIKIVYDNPWFWKVSASKWAPSSDSQDRGAPQRSRAHIEFEEEPRYRVTDEFGHRPERRDDSKESRRPEHRDYRRNAADSKKSIAPTLSRKSERPVVTAEKPIAPTLSRKSERPVVTAEKIVPRSPSSSPPRQRIDDTEVTIDYGNASIPPLSKRKLGGAKAKKPAAELVVKQEEPSEELEEGEVVEQPKTIFTGLSEEDRKASEELYGDLM
jgi:hypothetical protein